MSQLIHEAVFPSVMRDKLRSVRWRQAGVSTLRAAAIGISVLLVTMTAAMLIDWCFTIFDSRVRILLTSTSLGLSLFSLAVTGIRPVIAAFGWTRAAGNVDERIPQMEERWRTVASFAESNHQLTNAVSKAMLAQVTSEAVAMSTLVKPQQIVQAVSLQRPAMGLGLASLALAGFMVTHWQQTSILWQRFWSPMLNISATQLKCITGDIVVPRGDSVEIVTRMSGLQRTSALMSMNPETGSALEELELSPVADQPGLLSAAVDVDESFRYRIQAGDGRTEWHTVTAIDYPVLSEIRMTVTPPEYVDEPATEKTLIPGRLRAIQGSQLELAMKPEQELQSLTLVLTLPVKEAAVSVPESTPGDLAINEDSAHAKTIQKKLTLTRADDGWYHFETQLDEDFTLSPLLLSPHGLTNENPRVCRIEVIEDKAPVARIISPNEEMAVNPDEKIEIKFEAHDDHGIATAELVIYETETKEGEEPKILAVKQIPLGDQQMQKHVLGKTELDLKELGLDEGKSISYAVRVTDNRMLEMDLESMRNRLMASSDETHQSESDPRDNTSKTADSENTGDQKKNGEKSAAATEGQEQLTMNDAESQSNETDRNTDSKSPKEADPDAPNPEVADSETLIADTGVRQPSSREPAADGIEKMIEDDRQRAAAKPADGTQNEPTDPATGKKATPDSAQNGETTDPLRAPDVVDGNNDSPDTVAKVDGLREPMPKDEGIAGAKSGDADLNSDPATGEPKSGDLAASDLPKDEGEAGAKSGDADLNTNPATGEPKSGDLAASDMPKDEGDAGAKSGDADLQTDPATGEPKSGDLVASDMPKNEGETGAKSGDADLQTDPATGEPKPGEIAAAEMPKDEGEAGAKTGDPDQKTDTPAAVKKSEVANSPNTPANLNKKNTNSIPGGKSGSSQEPPPKIMMTAQRSDAGQQQETDRMKLKISARLDALAGRNEDQKTDVKPIRDKVVQIDKMLEVIETKLNALYRHKVQDDLRGEGFKELDIRLGDVESFVSELNLETVDSAFEFVGLQMVDISSAHVTPARDAVFVAIRKPDSGADVHAEEALHHVVSARELLLALLRKYDSVVQEQELAKKIDEAIKMYTVYVEGSQQLLREAQQNFDPLKLQREITVVEVDQAYLDRLAEVTKMRRDMMSELAKILGDDPRLRSRYLDLIKRRRASLRSQLAELAAKQDQAAQEVMGWLGVSDNQRDNYWLQISDLRLDLPKELAKEAQQFADRVEKQMPLVLNSAQGSPAMIIQLAKQIALDVRRCDFEVRELRKAGGEATESTGLSTSASDLVYRIGELSAAMDKLNFENETQEGVADFVQLRLAENRALADQADTWAETAGAIERKQFFGLASLDQHQITVATELLRAEILNIEADLAGEFNEENPMPQEITNLAQELMRAMESLTFNQSSATFAFAGDRLDAGATQQELALKGIEEAGRILDQLRRRTIEALDKEEVDDPSIADLEDPTLDQFLANLEREPNIEAQLGIPNRPRNIRVLQDTMEWTQNGGMMLGASGEAAMARIQKQMKQQLNASGEKETKNRPPETREMTEEEKKQLAESKDMQQMLKDQMQQTMKEMEKRAADPATSEQQRQQMKEMAQRMSKALEEMKDGQNPEQMWRRMVEAEQAKAAMEALAKGETLPDDQWNKLMSTLDDGLGQVGGRTPPEDYRKAIEQYQDRIRQLTGGAGGG